MNLYGEDGNIKALETFIKRQGVDVEVDNLSIDDDISFKDYDFYYIGSGMEESEDIVLKNLFKYKKAIQEAIKDGKMFLVTGNAMEIFGRKMRSYEGLSYDCLGILNYNAVQPKDRLVSEIFYEFEELEPDKGRNFVAFKNVRANIVNNEEEKLFKFPDNVRKNNFFGMMLTGPVLIRNPYFTDYLLDILFKSKGLNYQKDDSGIEYMAYHEFVKNFIINGNLD